MSEHEEEPTTGIDDDALPDDLVPSADNPLAQGLEEGETVDDLLDGGQSPDESDESDAEDDPDD